MRCLSALWVAFALTLAQPAFAVSPDEVLADPLLEQRARDISAELRCLVCQNQSIDDSNADLAKDLRVLVRERLVTGDTDEQVRQYLVDRYGEFVLFRPAFSPGNAVLWLAPFLLLAGGGGLLLWRRERGRSVAAPLTAEEERELQVLLAPGAEPDDRNVT